MFYTNYLLDSSKINKTLVNLNLFSFYEVSYFWFLKRFYLFNNLSTNKFSYSLSNKLNVDDKLNTNTNIYLLKLTSILKSNLISNYAFDNFSIVNNTIPTLHSNITKSKDLIVLRSESDLINLEDDSIMMDLFTNSVSNSSVNIFSPNLTNISHLSSTSFKPLSSSNVSSNNQILTTNTVLNHTFTRDLLSLLKIY